MPLKQKRIYVAWLSPPSDYVIRLRRAHGGTGPPSLRYCGASSLSRPAGPSDCSAVMKSNTSAKLICMDRGAFCNAIFCVLLVLADKASAQDRAWELMDELDVSSESPRQNNSNNRISDPALNLRTTPITSEIDQGHSNIEILTRNLSTEDVVRRLGQPDSIRSGMGNGADVWVYGKSLLFFANKQLSGWSDFGDIRARAVSNLSFLPTAKKKPNFFDEGWKNAWEQQSRPNPGVVIDELLSNEENNPASPNHSSDVSATESLSASSEVIDGSLPRKSSSNLSSVNRSPESAASSG